MERVDSDLQHGFAARFVAFMAAMATAPGGGLRGYFLAMVGSVADQVPPSDARLNHFVRPLMASPRAW